MLPLVRSHPTRSGLLNGKELPKLAQSIHDVHARLRIPDIISFLDGRIHLSWRFAPQSVDRYEEVSVDAKLLHYLSWATRSGREEYLHQHGYELTQQSPGSEIWSRVGHMAKAR